MYIHTHAYIYKVRACAHERHRVSLGEVFMEYMWSIRGIFIEYTYVSGMCRVCIGYVSGMYRESIEKYNEREGCAIKFRVDICRFQKKAVPL